MQEDHSTDDEEERVTREAIAVQPESIVNETTSLNPADKPTYTPGSDPCQSVFIVE